MNVANKRNIERSEYRSFFCCGVLAFDFLPFDFFLFAFVPCLILVQMTIVIQILNIVTTKAIEAISAISTHIRNVFENC